MNLQDVRLARGKVNRITTKDQSVIKNPYFRIPQKATIPKLQVLSIMTLNKRGTIDNAKKSPMTNQ